MWRRIIDPVTDCLTVRARTCHVFVGDLLPAFMADVAEDGRPFDFTDWSLTFTLSGPVTVSGAASGDDEGVLSYSWLSGQTATPGDYTAYFTGTSPDLKQRTFEVEGVFRIQPP